MKPQKKEIAPKAVSPSEIRFAVLSTDIVCFRIIEGKLCVLLGKINAKGNPFEGDWALIGGLIRPDEIADKAAERLLLDKAGVSNVYKEQLYTFSEIDRDPRGRVVSVAYLSLTSDDPQDLSKAHWETKWTPVDNLPKLAYDHKEILSVGLDRLRSKIRYTTLPQYLLPKEFTLSDLQCIYEIVLGEKLDKRNFRKKILASDILKETGNTRKEGVMRPAALYAFTSKKPKITEIL
jgi:8-oxo-dGTP diphosphatase